MTFRRLFLHNFGLKLVSLVLASLLWLLVQAGLHDDDDYAPRFTRVSNPREFVRPVRVLTDIAAGGRFRAEPREVTVAIGGPGVQELQANEVNAFIELLEPAKMKGEMSFRVQVRFPRSLKLAKVTPETVLIRPVEAP